MEVINLTKRLIDIDDELLATAQEELGTEGVSDTVRLALRIATITRANARRVEGRLQYGAPNEEMADPASRAAVWR
jgi:Arc/MetJ family transcription regulator